MMSTAAAQKLPAVSCAPSDPVFDAEFFAPYEAAVQTALGMLCAARARHESDVLALRFRLKSPASIRGKLRKKGLPETAQAAGLALRDVAGLRAVLASRQAVYRFAHTLMVSGLAQLDEVHDYIAAPKRSGYRSLHLIFSVPVMLDSQAYLVPVEIQLRTPSMDAWACMEHRLIYKPVASDAARGAGDGAAYAIWNLLRENTPSQS